MVTLDSRDYWASAADIGTGNDSKTAEASSEVDKVRRLRVETPAFGWKALRKAWNTESTRGINQ